MNPVSNPRRFYGRAIGVQLRIVGALMMRELHTRFGRNNVGYLWLILEPMILSVGISAVHLFTHVSLPFGFSPASFYATGYITFIVFRNNVNRAPALIESNKPLLYHRHVQLFDISIARSFLDVLASSGAMIVMLSAFILLGLSAPPERPWLLVAGLATMGLLSTGLSMMVTAFVEINPIIERFVHPATYLLLPFTGMFFILGELPPDYARFLSWAVLPQITDLARMGLASSYNSEYLNLPYVFTVSAFAWLIGLAGLRVARRQMHFD